MVFCVASLLLLIQARSPSFDLTILHTNDLHGHVLPFAYQEVGKGTPEQPLVGGATRRATLIRRLRSSIQQPVILVDSGDTFTRGPLTNAYEGIADIEAMNAVGYEIAELGNNEFKAKDAREQNDAKGSQDALMRVVRRSRFSWICANATDSKGAFLTGVEPFVVRELGGVRVGFLGLTAPRSAAYPQTKGWNIADPISSAKEWIPEARKECDVLIAITHIGVELDLSLARATRGIDAIVGGDSHTFLYKAIEAKNADGARVPIVQDGEFGVRLGRFDLHFEQGADHQYHLASYKYELLPVGPSLPEAQDVKAVIEPYVKPLQVVVGEIPVVGNTPDERLTLTGKAISEALRAKAGAEIGVLNSGGLFNVFLHRQITRYDIWAAMPFKNNLATAELTGAELKKILGKKKVDFSGLKSAEDLVPDRTYKVAFVDFDALVLGVPVAKLHSSDIDVREAVVDDLKFKG